MSLTFSVLGNQAHALKSIFSNNPEPLSVEKAFAPAVTNISDEQIEISFDIAKGYYLYESKFGFSANDAAVTIGAPIYPTALIHEDEFFGKSNIHRNKATIKLPITRSSDIRDIILSVEFQGCADVGLCYPPTTKPLSVQLPAAQVALDNTTSTAAQTSLLKPKLDLQSLIKPKSSFSDTGSSQALLHPSEAFIPSVITANKEQISIEWLIQPGYYLYRDKIKAELLASDGATVTSIDIDRGKMQNDAYFGDVEVLREIPSARISIDNADNLATAQLEIFYQGCADIGVCFPPESKVLPVLFSNTNGVSNAAIASVNAKNLQTTDNNSSTQLERPVSEQDKLSSLLEAGNLGIIALAFYGAGLLLAFTACVYPMIPILSSLIVGHGEKLSTAKAFSLSSVYVLSMASVFAIVGVLIGLSGYNIQPLFQNPWVLTAFAALFVALALSMFGLYELQMPSALQSKVTELSNKQSSGTYTGVAVMGVLSALIVGPCVTPPLVAALAYIAKTGDATIGGIALFAIGLGMGTPLLLIGTSLGKFMPKAGGWMQTTQRIFGVILLIVAIYLLSRFLPGNIIMMMYAGLAIFTGVFFGATDRLDEHSHGVKRFAKSVGIIAILYGVVLFIGAFAGNTSMLSPLKGLVGQNQINGQANIEKEHLSFKRIKSVADLNAVLVNAKANRQAVMLDFYADWCVSCKEMEAFTFPDPSVKEQLRNTIVIQADVTKNDADDKALLERFGLFGPPAIILYDRDGNELEAGRVVGYMKAEKFSAHLQAYLNN